MIFSPGTDFSVNAWLVYPSGVVGSYYDVNYVGSSYGNVEIYISVKHKYMTCCCNSVGRVSNF